MHIIFYLSAQHIFEKSGYYYLIVEYNYTSRKGHNARDVEKKSRSENIGMDTKVEPPPDFLVTKTAASDGRCCPTLMSREYTPEESTPEIDDRRAARNTTRRLAENDFTRTVRFGCNSIRIFDNR